jgi:hypothetical protein
MPRPAMTAARGRREAFRHEVDRRLTCHPPTTVGRSQPGRKRGNPTSERSPAGLSQRVREPDPRADAQLAVDAGEVGLDGLDRHEGTGRVPRRPTPVAPAGRSPPAPAPTMASPRARRPLRASSSSSRARPRCLKRRWTSPASRGVHASQRVGDPRTRASPRPRTGGTRGRARRAPGRDGGPPARASSCRSRRRPRTRGRRIPPPHRGTSRLRAAGLRRQRSPVPWRRQPYRRAVNRRGLTPFIHSDPRCQRRTRTVPAWLGMEVRP